MRFAEQPDGSYKFTLDDISIDPDQLFGESPTLAGLGESSGKTRPGDVVYAGYHGTSLTNAARIAEEGFDQEGRIYFATLDNLSFAQTHGQHRAGQVNDDRFAVVQVTFPPQEVEQGLVDRQISIDPSRADEITVVNVLEFDVPHLLRQAPNTF